MNAAQDAELPDDVRPRPATGHGAHLVTGASGFLGAALTAELLSVSHREVACLVRAREGVSPTTFMRSALQFYGLWREEWRSRLRVLAGDLTRPRLGLSDDDHRWVTDSVGHIHHCGAVVNASFPYRALRAANVNGTVEVLRLACQGRPKRVSHASTIGVLWSADNAGRTVDETRPLSSPHGLPPGYAESKWVAERLVEQARARGLHAHIFRIGALGGNTRTGVSNPQDARWLMVRTCAALGIAPVLSAPLGWAPVDYASSAMVILSTQQPGVHHLVERNEVPWLEAFSWMRRYGFRLRAMDPHAWRDRVRAAAATSDRDEVVALAATLPEGSEPPPAPTLIEAHRTERTLTALGIVCPPLDRPLFDRYLAAGVQGGMLPRPARALRRVAS